MKRIAVCYAGSTECSNQTGLRKEFQNCFFLSKFPDTFLERAIEVRKESENAKINCDNS